MIGIKIQKQKCHNRFQDIKEISEYLAKHILKMLNRTS